MVTVPVVLSAASCVARSSNTIPGQSCFMKYPIALYQIHDELSEAIRAEGLDIRYSLFWDRSRALLGSGNIFQSFKVETIYRARLQARTPCRTQHHEGVQNNIFGTETLVRAAIDARLER